MSEKWEEEDIEYLKSLSAEAEKNLKEYFTWLEKRCGQLAKENARTRLNEPSAKIGQLEPKWPEKKDYDNHIIHSSFRLDGNEEKENIEKELCRVSCEAFNDALSQCKAAYVERFGRSEGLKEMEG